MFVGPTEAPLLVKPFIATMTYSERREANVIDAAAAGATQGLHLALNIAAMLVAFIAMIALVNAGVGWVGGWFGHPELPRATIIAAYALCGFATIATIAIQIGGLGGIAPERRGDLSRLGFLAMIGGNLATFMTASLAGMLL